MNPSIGVCVYVSWRINLNAALENDNWNSSRWKTDENRNHLFQCRIFTTKTHMCTIWIETEQKEQKVNNCIAIAKFQTRHFVLWTNSLCLKMRFCVKYLLELVAISSMHIISWNVEQMPIQIIGAGKNLNATVFVVCQFFVLQIICLRFVYLVAFYRSHFMSDHSNFCYYMPENKRKFCQLIRKRSDEYSLTNICEYHSLLFVAHKMWDS